MPLPTPNNGEEESKFISRCVSAVFDEGTLNGKPVSKDSEKDRKQAAAACYGQWRKGKSATLKREWTAEMRKKLKDGEMKGEFAGPDESFPIASPEDVHAAYMSAGRAGGDPETIHRAVIRIAKKYGWESGLPDTVKEKMKEKSVALPGIITKAQRMKDGRVRWRATVNSGQFDQDGERFDRSFFEEVVKNFAVQQEMLSKGVVFPISVELDDGYVLKMNEPIQDIAHYSYFVDDRSKARTGYPIKLWLDGAALRSEGYYDSTPLGELAAKAALAENDPKKRRMSLGVYPDWGLVEDLPDGRRVFKGGRGRSWLDHEAITSYPVDADTEIVTLSEVSDMPTQKDDAINVLGDEAEELIDELEKAKTKSSAEGAVLKSEEEEKVEDKVEEKKDEAATDADTESKSDPESEMKSFLADFMPKFGGEIMKRMDAAIKSLVGDRLDKIEAKIEALSADETQKLKSILDGEDWVADLAEKSLSVQHGEAVVKGDAEKVKETHQPDDMEQAWGNPED